MAEDIRGRAGATVLVCSATATATAGVFVAFEIRFLRRWFAGGGLVRGALDGLGRIGHFRAGENLPDRTG